MTTQPDTWTTLTGLNTNSSSSVHIDRATDSSDISLAGGPWIMLAYGIIYPPLIIATILSNALVILTFIKTKSLHKASNYFLISLAVTDLLTGVISIPCHLIGRLIISPVTCWTSTRFLFFMPTVMLSSASVYHLLAIAVDRLISVYRPLQHASIVTPFRVQVSLATMWIFNICFGLLPVIVPDPSDPEWACRPEPYGHQLNAITLTIAGFIPLHFVVLIALYVVMLYKAANHITRHSQLTKHVQTQRHGLATMSMIVGAFGLCFLPSSFLYIYEVYGEYTMKQLIIIQTICEYPVFMNSVINPVIYCLRNRDLRGLMKDTAHGIVGRRAGSERNSGWPEYGSTSMRPTSVRSVNRVKRAEPSSSILYP